MKKLIALLIFSAAAFAQNTTTITATAIHGSGITLLASGKLCFTPVDDSGNPQGYRAGAGGQGTVDEKCATVTNGAISSWSVDNPDFTSPLHIKYTIRVTDSNQAGKEIRRDTAVDMAGNGGTWSYDTFTPSAGTALGNFSCSTGFVVGGITSSGQLVCVAGGGGTGLASLNALIASTQVFANDTNIGISSSGFTHSLTWSGTLAKNRQNAQTVYLDAAAQTFVNGITAPTITGALIGNASTASALASTPSLCGAGNYPLGILANGNATGCTPASGAGTVTNFSAGNLSPLFSTNVATSTSTPALTFTLSNAGANTVFGNNTGSTAAPAFVSLTKAMQQSQTAYLDSIQTFTAAQTFTPQIVATGGLIVPNNVPLQGHLSGGTVVNFFNYDAGNILSIGANNEIQMSGQVTIQPPSTAGITFKTGLVDSGTVVGIVNDTLNSFATTGAKLTAWRNATVEKASLSYDGFFNAVGGYKVGGSALNFSHLAGSAACGQLPAETGDVTSSGCATTLATVNGNVGTFMKLTVNGKGLVTAATTAAVADLSDGATVATKSGTQNQSYSYLADSGAADAYVITLSPAVGSYVAGQRFSFKVANSNLTTTPTLNVNALGTKTITKLGTGALAAGDLAAGCIVEVTYNGTQMQLTSPPCQTAGGAGTVTHTAGSLTSGQLLQGNGSADITVGNLSGAVTTAGNTTTVAGKDDLIDASTNCAAAGASGSAYTCNLTPAVSAYVTGVHYRFKADVANTGAATINFNSVGAIALKKKSANITTALAASDLCAGQWVDLVYDGTNMQVQSTLCPASGGAGGYATIQSPLGTGLTQQTTVAVRDGLVAADDSGNSRSIIDSDPDISILFLKEDFVAGSLGGGNNIGQLSWGVTPFNCYAPDDTQYAFPHVGLVKGTTGATSGNSCTITLSDSGFNYTFGDPMNHTNTPWKMRIVFKLLQTTAYGIRVGLGNSLTFFSGVFMRYDTANGDTNFMLANKTAGSETAVSLGVAADTSWHTLAIYSDGATSGEVFMSLDGGTAKTVCSAGCDLTATPATGGVSVILWETTNANAAKSMDFDYFDWKWRLNTTQGVRN